jgi:hypothetical protein
MSSPDPLPCINPNPDISGVGVRVSIYVQAFFNIVCAIIFSRDTWISDFEHTILTTTSLNLFLIGCALLLSTVIQGATLGLTVHHALIVLNLNWIVGLSALLYVFIWTYNIVAAWFSMPLKRRPEDDEYDERTDRPPSGRSLLYLSTLHLCGTGLVGIWLWKTVKTFGDQQECTPLTVSGVFGKNISVLNATLRRVSLAIYWIAALPFVNLLIVFLAALVALGLMACVYSAIRWLVFKNLSWRTFSLFGGIFVIILLEVAFIVDTEIMISRPGMEALVKDGEGTWTFGQTLALVVLVVPLVETVKIVVRAHQSQRKKVQPWDRPPRRPLQPAPFQVDEPW